MIEKRACVAMRVMNRYQIWKLIHLVSAVFVLSYVFFQVLDLDLSDFPLKAAPEERAVVLTEATETTELTNAISEDSFRLVVLQSQPSVKQVIRFQQKNFFHPALQREVRIYLHRLKIPRSSALDSSSAA